MRELRRDFLGTISRANREIGGLARISAGPPGWRITAYSVSSPDLAAEILGQPDRFRKNGPGYRELRQALGENLLTSEDESWHRQRRFLAPIFTRRRIATDYVHIMIEESERHRCAWMPFGAGPRGCIGMQIAMLEIPIVIAAVLQAFTLDTPLTSIPVHAAITLQPTGTLPLQLRSV
jgi:cytochrome P450